VNTDDNASAGEDPFWRWSCSVYARTGVAEALIALQDDYGLNVNIALWCAWRAATGSAPAREEIAAAKTALAAFNREATQRLRRARRALKTMTATETATDADGRLFDGLRQSVKALELEAERVEQAILRRQDPAGAPSSPAQETADARADAMRALTDYADLADASADQRRDDLIAGAIGHIFPATDR